MIRTQISLTKGQHAYLNERKQRTGESISSMIRRALEYLRQLESDRTPQGLTSAEAQEKI